MHRFHLVKCHTIGKQIVVFIVKSTNPTNYGDGALRSIVKPSRVRDLLTNPFNQ